MKKLFTSYKFWTAFAGSVGVLLMALSDTIGISINVDGVKETIMAFCGVLIVFGVVQTPKPKTEQKQEGIELNTQDQENKS